MKKTLTATEFNFENQTSVYHGKVRDVYSINNETLVMIATDKFLLSTLFYQKEFHSKDKC